MMLFLKRTVTAAVLFVILFLVLYTVTSAIFGGIAGARAAGNRRLSGPEAFEVGKAASREMNQKYGLDILLGSVGVAVVISSALSYGGAFPWCRPMALPPKLPPRPGLG